MEECCSNDKCCPKPASYPQILNCNSNDENAPDAVPEPEKHCDKEAMCQSFIYIEVGFLHARTVRRFEDAVNTITHDGDWVVSVSIMRSPLRTTCIANFALVRRAYSN